ncbi:MAG: oligosaccharide flippase family protein [Bacteroides sp.]|nr:oligosaccharide flippase family protein [Bacteroides sp.]
MVKNSDSNTRQAIWVAIGSCTAFGFTIISSMILSRYFNKVEYGTYKQVMYVYSTLLIIFTLGLPQAFGYFLPRVPIVQGKSIVNKITIVLLFMGLIFSMSLFIGSSLIASILKNPDLITAIRIFSPVPLLLLPTMGLDSIYATYKKTYVSAIYNILTKILQLIFVIVPIFIFSPTVKVALIGFVIASFISALIALYLKNKPFKGYTNIASNYNIKDIIRFSLPLMAAGIWGMIINSTDQFFISRYFGTVTFAEFSNGAMELPFVGMIVSACSTVLYPLFSKYSHDGLDAKEKIYPIWLSVFSKTAMLIYPLVVFCWFYSSQIMEFLYGTQYEHSGIYFRIKLFGNLFTLIAFAPVILSIGATKYYAKVHAYGAIVLVILEWLAVKIVYDPYIVIVISVLCHISRILLLLHLIAKYFKVSLIMLFPINLIFKIIVPSSILLLILERFLNLNSLFLELLIGGSVYIIFMVVVSIILKINYKTLFKSLVK